MDSSKILILACAIAGTMHAAHADVLPGTPPAPEIGLTQSAPPIQRPVSLDDRPVLVPTVAEYQWIFRVPVVVMEHRRITVTVPTATMHSRHWDYEMPDLRDRHVMLWQVPEFGCKYPDVSLPNDCRTVWRNVYVDVPVLASQHIQVDVDVPRFGFTETSIAVDIPHWTWTEKRFRFSLPALAPPDVAERLRVSLSTQRDAVTAATDESIAILDRDIEAVRAGGEDPAKVVSADGSKLDLLAHRQTLVDQRTQELERLSDIDAELSLLLTQR